MRFQCLGKDLAQFLSGLTLRVPVMQQLIDILRASGYPGYETDGINAAARVAQRLDERYRQVYGEATFTPAAVKQAVRVHEKTALSLVQDKVATPAEGLQSIDGWQRATRPSHIVAERSVQSQSNINENDAAVFICQVRRCEHHHRQHHDKSMCAVVPRNGFPIHFA